MVLNVIWDKVTSLYLLFSGYFFSSGAKDNYHPKNNMSIIIVIMFKYINCPCKTEIHVALITNHTWKARMFCYSPSLAWDTIKNNFISFADISRIAEDCEGWWHISPVDQDAVFYIWNGVTASCKL